jgi:hypothetical protein
MTPSTSDPFNVEPLNLILYLETGCFLLRTPPGDGIGTGIETDPSEAETTEDKEFIRCRKCGNPVTHPSERISMDGSHAHTFANPGGILYEIGCFRSVVGCGYMGPTTDDFSWFKGYSWKVIYCGKCSDHLGWLFISPVNDPFNGLILDRLTDPE